MKGISAVIAIVMILMITISLSAMSYMWFNEMFSEVSEEGSLQTQAVTRDLNSRFIIESAKGSNIYVRNTGDINLTDFEVYIDDEKVYFENEFDVLGSGESGKITVGAYDGYEEKSRDVYVTTSGGLSGRKTQTIDKCENDDLVLCYTFDEGIGNIVDDYSKYDNDGTLYGIPLYVSGISGNALSFDGIDDYIHVEYTNVTDSVTVEVWVKSASNNFYSGHLSIVSDYDRFVLGRPDEGVSRNMAFMVYDGSSWKSSGSFEVPFGEPARWHHFVGTRDSTTGEIKFYYDGELALNATGDVGILNEDDTDLEIGHDEASILGVNYFKGQIDELRIYDRALTDSEVKFRYDSAAPIEEYFTYENCDLFCEDTDCVNNNNTEGIYICLDSDIITSGNGIDISADNQTLDCMGHTINGSSGTTTTTGIDIGGRFNVTVKNCIVNDFSYPIYFSGNSRFCTVENNIVTSEVRPTWGIYSRFSGNVNNSIIGNTVHDVEAPGIHFEVSGLNYSIIGNTLYNNLDCGVRLYYSDYDTLINNTAYNNSVHGICISSGSNYNIISNNIAYNNNRHGIWSGISGGNTFINNYACYNNISGGNYFDTYEQANNDWTSNDNMCDTNYSSVGYDICREFCWCMDPDCDGYGEGLSEETCMYPEKDCNNFDASIYPGAPELPNGKDNDCDGNIDE